MKYGILEDKGFLVLTGEVGTGKTLLINKLVSDCPVPAIIVTIPDPALRPLEFFHYLAEEAGMETKFTGKGEFWVLFRQFLLQVYEFEKKVLLIIDEAQRLSFKVLEQTRLMSNFLKPDKKLINIFFVGQNEFINVLSDKRSKGLMQRVTTRCQLHPFTEDETLQYINHRLAVAGAKTEIFSREAVELTYNYSRGLPRSINVICDNALRSGFSSGANMITADVIKSAIEQIPAADKKSPEPREKPILKPVKDKKPSAVPMQTPAGKQPETLPEIGRTSESEVQMQVDEPPTTSQKHKKFSGVAPQISVGEDVNDRFFQIFPRKARKMLLIGAVVILIGSTVYLVYDGHHSQPQSSQGLYEDILPRGKFFTSKNEMPELAPEQVILKKIEDTELSTKTMKNKEGAHQVSNSSASFGESTGLEQVPPEKQILPTLPGIETDKTSLSSKAEKFALNKPDNDNYESTQTQSVVPLPEEKNIIHFEHNSNEISEQAYRRLDEVFQIISGFPNSEIIIEGYTDSSGDIAYNEKISVLRADRVRSFFISKGIDPLRIKAVGLGAQNFIATNDTKAGRGLNRRVEITIQTQ